MSNFSGKAFFRPFTLLLFSLCFGGSFSYAQPPKSGPALVAAIYTSYENPNLLYIRLDNFERGHVIVSLRTDSNERLYATTTRRYQYNLRLDLSNLKDGSYRVQVADKNQTFARTLQIGTLYARPQRVVEIIEPTFTPAHP